MSDEFRTAQQMFDNVVQIGVIVRDIEKSARTLTDIFGIGSFRIVDWRPVSRESLERSDRGAPANLTGRLGFAMLGTVELELIQPVEGTNMWSDLLREHGEGLHHIRFNVPDAEFAGVRQYVVGRGIEIAQMGSGIRPGTSFINYDTESLVGFCIKIVNVLPGTDGRTPVGHAT